MIIDRNLFWLVSKDLTRHVGINASVLYSCLIQKKSKYDGADYFPFSSNEITNEMGISYTQQKAAIKILIQNEFIKTKLIGIPATLHFKFVQDGK